MATGSEMLMKQIAKGMGIDFAKVAQDFEQLKSGVLATLEQINTKLATIEKRQIDICQMIQLLPNMPQPQCSPQQPQPVKQPQPQAQQTAPQ